MSPTRMPRRRGVRTLIALAATTALLASGSAAAQAASTAPAAGAAEVSDPTPDPFIRDVDTWLTTSAADRTYKISVALPSGYDPSAAPYRVLYVTDANAEFGLAVETARLVAPKTVVVAIGYDDPGQGFTASGVRRTLDLTPTDIGVATPSGGAPEFLAFLRDELIPEIEDDYNVSPDDRGLMGHSFGGLFATYALLHDDGLFDRFVIASPSLWWDDHTILETEAEYAATHDAMPARVFLSVGSLEETTTGFPMTSDMTSFVWTLAGRGYEGLELGAHVFPDETHTSSIGSSFSRGLRFIYAEPGTDVPGTSLAEFGEPPTDTAPQVTGQPADASVEEGAEAAFTASASGTPAPSVQWQSRASADANWADVADATGMTLTLGTTTADDSGTQYRAVFTNPSGQATTDAATLTVTAAAGSAGTAADAAGSADGEPAAAGQGSVPGDGTGALASTGGGDATGGMLTIAALVLAAGGGLILRRRGAPAANR